MSKVKSAYDILEVKKDMRELFDGDEWRASKATEICLMYASAFCERVREERESYE